MARRKTLRRAGGALAVGAAVALVAACGGHAGTGGSGGGSSVTIGSLLPLTGDLAALGKNTHTAVELAVEQADKANAGVKVTLESQDGGTQESVAQSAIQRLLSKNASAVVGAVSSAVCLSVMDTIVQSQTVMISPACTTPQLTTYPDNGYFFRTAAPSDSEGAVLANVAYQDGRRKVALVSLNNSYGQSLADAFAKQFKQLGGSIVATIKYDSSAKTFTAEAQQIAAAQPDAVALVAYVDTGAAIAHDAAQQGLLKLPWYVTDGIEDATFPKKASASDPSAVYGWNGIGVGTPDSPAYKSFADAYQKKFGTEPPSFAAQAYDAAWIAILASVEAKHAGTSTKEQMSNVTSASGTACSAAQCLSLAAQGKPLHYQGATGDVAFDEHGDPANPLFALWTFDASGIKTLKTISGTAK